MKIANSPSTMTSSKFVNQNVTESSAHDEFMSPYLLIHFSQVVSPGKLL